MFGGFRMIASPLHADAWSYPHHFVGAGTLVRNYVEIVATSGGDMNTLNLYGIVASACSGGVSVLRCNDIYVRSDAPQTFVVSAVEYGNHALHAGQGVLDGNRICQDGGGFATDAIGGYGSCFPAPVSLLMRNNVIETAGSGGSAIDFYSCGSDDMSFTLTNNTVIGASEAIRGSGDAAVMMRWKLTNNIFFSAGGGQTAVNAGDVGVEITTSEGNLIFGFADNAIHPAPLLSAGDDVSGAATPASVFVDAMNGDLHPKAGGQAVDTGLNVFGLPAYGVVTTDIAQQLRPPQGPWDRGALGSDGRDGTRLIFALSMTPRSRLGRRLNRRFQRRIPPAPFATSPATSRRQAPSATPRCAPRRSASGDIPSPGADRHGARRQSAGSRRWASSTSAAMSTTDSAALTPIVP
ncbi:hypothetical protein OV079_52005 [Nannocystis pusilla]|uniref:Uncharacterized protein n=1 Tax=Nannocystis pusilla TaxID=889268 RepID=A0A9X3J3L5_9BACT|nr:hypothetical protein [Nannocystis pusilla]MCY1013916.1 hypothetical protein [Nannocystis pusilla]